MSNEVIVLGQSFAVTLGLAAFVGVPGRLDGHAHWTHQIAIDLDGQEISCLCEGQLLSATGVFVPAGHSHSVKSGRQINLFFDVGVNWIDDLFGGKLDTSCARVLDRDTLMGIQSCFYQDADLHMGMDIFAKAFEVRANTRLDPNSLRQWEHILAEVKAIQHTGAPLDDAMYPRLGALFAAKHTGPHAQ